MELGAGGYAMGVVTRGYAMGVVTRGYAMGVVAGDMCLYTSYHLLVESTDVECLAVHKPVGTHINILDTPQSEISCDRFDTTVIEKGKYIKLYQGMLPV